MINLLPNLAGVIILAIVVLIRGRDRGASSDRTARGLQIAGLVLLGLQVGFFLLFAVGEMVEGDLGGAGHLVQAAAAGLPGYLAWLRPLEGGIVLILLGAISAVYFNRDLALLLILAGTPLLAGVLFLTAGWQGRRSNKPERDLED